MNGPKIKRLYFSTREVSEQVNITSQVLRSWERRFGFLRPTKSKSGRKLYKPSEIELVRQIKSYIDQGFTDGYIEHLIKTGKENPVTQQSDYNYNMEREVPVHEIITTLKEIIQILDSRDP